MIGCYLIPTACWYEGKFYFSLNLEQGETQSNNFVGGFSGSAIHEECPFCPELGDGHFGHVRFKTFLFVDFDGHLEWGHDVVDLEVYYLL